MKNSFNNLDESEDKEIKLSIINEKLNDKTLPATERQHYLNRKNELLSHSAIKKQKPTQNTYQVSHGWSRKKIFASVLCLMVFASAFSFVVGTNMAYSVAFKEGAHVGYTTALSDTANLLQQKGITLDWNQQNDGSYLLTVKTLDGQTSQVTIAANLLVEIRGPDGKLKETSRGAGTFTNLGKNWTLCQLSKVTNALGTRNAPNASQYASYLGESETSAGIGVTSVILPSELATSGLSRANATSQTFISTGSWNCSVVKTVVDVGKSPLIWGLYYDAADGIANSLVAYDTTPGTKNLSVGDTETETWTITVT